MSDQTTNPNNPPDPKDAPRITYMAHRLNLNPSKRILEGLPLEGGKLH